MNRRSRKKSAPSRPLDTTPTKISKIDDLASSLSPPDKNAKSSKKCLRTLSPTIECTKSTRSKAVGNTDTKDTFQKARRTLNNAYTYNLVGRESELQDLSQFLEKGLTSAESSSMYISGPPGTGKTACLLKLLNASKYTKQFKQVFVNCTSIASTSSIYKKICTALKLEPGTEKQCLQKINKYLRSKHKAILLVLDEIDQLSTKNQSVLYTIFEWPAVHNSNLLLIGIANSLDLTDRFLSRLHAKCELKPHLLHFTPYSKQQLIDIFKGRLEEAQVLDLFPPATIQLLAAKVSSISGDVRRALDIGRRVVDMVQQQQRDSKTITSSVLGMLDEIASIEGSTQTKDVNTKVEMKQVIQAINQVYGGSQSLAKDLEDAFPLQQKILICTILLILKGAKNKDITVSRLYSVYVKVCGKRNIPEIHNNEFLGLCELVETHGILRIIKSKEPRLSKVQLQWDEEEVRVALQDKQLIASILADTSCVSK